MEWKKHPLAPRPGDLICAIADLHEKGIKEVCLGNSEQADQKPFSMVIYKNGDMIRAYWNLCPHFRIPLNTPGGNILLHNDVLWCVHHSAEFHVEDGKCFSGPCRSGALERIELIDKAGQLYVV